MRVLKVNKENTKNILSDLLKRSPVLWENSTIHVTQL